MKLRTVVSALLAVATSAACISLLRREPEAPGKNQDGKVGRAGTLPSRPQSKSDLVSRLLQGAGTLDPQDSSPAFDYSRRLGLQRHTVKLGLCTRWLVLASTEPDESERLLLWMRDNESYGVNGMAIALLSRRTENCAQPAKRLQLLRKYAGQSLELMVAGFEDFLARCDADLDRHIAASLLFSRFAASGRSIPPKLVISAADSCREAQSDFLELAALEMASVDAVAVVALADHVAHELGWYGQADSPGLAASLLPTLNIAIVELPIGAPNWESVEQPIREFLLESELLTRAAAGSLTAEAACNEAASNATLLESVYHQFVLSDPDGALGWALQRPPTPEVDRAGSGMVEDLLEAAWEAEPSDFLDARAESRWIALAIGALSRNMTASGIRDLAVLSCILQRLPQSGSAAELEVDYPGITALLSHHNLPSHNPLPALWDKLRSEVR